MKFRVVGTGRVQGDLVMLQIYAEVKERKHDLPMRYPIHSTAQGVSLGL